MKKTASKFIIQCAQIATFVFSAQALLPSPGLAGSRGEKKQVRDFFLGVANQCMYMTYVDLVNQNPNAKKNIAKVLSLQLDEVNPSVFVADWANWYDYHRVGSDTRKRNWFSSLFVSKKTRIKETFVDHNHCVPVRPVTPTADHFMQCRLMFDTEDMYALADPSDPNGARLKDYLLGAEEYQALQSGQSTEEFCRSHPQMRKLSEEMEQIANTGDANKVLVKDGVLRTSSANGEQLGGDPAQVTTSSEGKPMITPPRAPGVRQPVDGSGAPTGGALDHGSHGEGLPPRSPVAPDAAEGDVNAPESAAQTQPPSAPAAAANSEGVKTSAEKTDDAGKKQLNDAIGVAGLGLETVKVHEDGAISVYRGPRSAIMMDTEKEYNKISELSAEIQKRGAPKSQWDKRFELWATEDAAKVADADVEKEMLWLNDQIQFAGRMLDAVQKESDKDKDGKVTSRLEEVLAYSKAKLMELAKRKAGAAPAVAAEPEAPTEAAASSAAVTAPASAAAPVAPAISAASSAGSSPSTASIPEKTTTVESVSTASVSSPESSPAVTTASVASTDSGSAPQAQFAGVPVTPVDAAKEAEAGFTLADLELASQSGMSRAPSSASAQATVMNGAFRKVENALKAYSASIETPENKKLIADLEKSKAEIESTKKEINRLESEARSDKANATDKLRIASEINIAHNRFQALIAERDGLRDSVATKIVKPHEEKTKVQGEVLNTATSALQGFIEYADGAIAKLDGMNSPENVTARERLVLARDQANARFYALMKLYQELGLQIGNRHILNSSMY